MASTSKDNDDFFNEIYLQHPSCRFKSIEQFRGFHHGIDDYVNRIIKQQPIEKINEAKKEALNQTLAEIYARGDNFAYSKETVENYCNRLPDNWLFNGGFYEEKLEFYCPCSPGQSRWRQKHKIVLSSEGFSDDCDSRKVFNTLEALMQHLSSNEGYLHFATKIYCQIVHGIGNKRTRNWNRNRATNLVSA